MMLLAWLGNVTALADNWVSLSPMPTPRSELPAVALGERIYLPGGFGGMNRLESYTPAADRWQQHAPLPARRHHAMATGHEGQLYLFGGANFLWQATDTAWRYDPIKDRWQDIARLPEARYGGAAVTLSGYLYVVGGVGGNSDLLRYDPTRDHWDRLAALRQAREHTTAVVFNGEIIAIAGRWESEGGELRSLEIYHPASDSWRAGPPLNAARGGHAAAVLDGVIYALGGEVIYDDFDTLSSVEALRSSHTSEWRDITPLPQPLHGVPAAVMDGALYVIGGSDRAATADNHGRVWRLVAPAAQK